MLFEAQQGADMGDQLTRFKGFCQVVVGAEFQAEHFIGDVSARGQHQDRDIAGQTADMPADRKTIVDRQQHVEDDQRRKRGRRQ